MRYHWIGGVFFAIMFLYLLSIAFETAVIVIALLITLIAIIRRIRRK